MNSSDFIVEFDLLYNNALSNSAPNINTYEKSLFLTQAQEDIIRDLYESKPKGMSYEQSERIRRRLESSTVHSNVTYNSTLNTSLTSLKISDNSKFFVISGDVWYITFEQVKTATKTLKVTPIPLDEYSVLDENPFKQPNTRKAWRLDVSNTVGDDKVVEIISNQTLTTYIYRYLTQPTPIVLVDLAVDAEYEGLDLTIQGISDETIPVLPAEAHRLILRRAVDLATTAYKENTLSNNVQINQNSL